MIILFSFICYVDITNKTILFFKKDIFLKTLIWLYFYVRIVKQLLKADNDFSFFSFLYEIYIK